MTSFILRRLLQFIPTVIEVTLIVFLLLNLVPGNAALATAGRLELDADAVEQLRKDFELDKPVVVRYLNYLGRLAQGEMGKSMLRRYAAAEVVFSRVWATLKLACAALGSAILIGVPLGLIAALRHGSWLDIGLWRWGLGQSGAAGADTECGLCCPAAVDHPGFGDRGFVD